MTDDIYDAMRDTIRALGGMAAVGKRMRPELHVKDAERWLSDATNRNRAQKLSPEQMLLLCKWGREAGAHALMDFITADAGYETTKPVVLTEQLAMLKRRAMTAQREAEQAASDLQTLINNPRLLALMQAAGVNVEAIS